MKKNDIFEIEITGMTDDGCGVGRAENIAVFVKYALLGERVNVIIIKTQKSYSVGKLLEVIKPSPKRLKASCEYFYKCGGCSFQNVQYEEELLYKHKTVSDSLKRIGKINCDVLPVVPSQNTEYYRNKSQFPVSEEGVGIYATHSHRVIDIDCCPIQAENTALIIRTVKGWMKDFNILPYDEKSDTGCIRHIYTRTGKKETMVVLVTRTKKLKEKEELVRRLKDADDSICSVMQNVNDKRTNVVLGREKIILWGKDYIVDSIGERNFKISPFSFYQINNRQTKVLYDIAKEYADVKKDSVVWDMYCGIGTIGQYAAHNAKKIVGVEVVEEAKENAKENAKINGLKNCEYHCGEAESLAPILVEKGLKPDIVFLDPPRKGCDKKLLDTIAGVGAEKIVYISCKPSTLARDLNYLEENGYKVKKVCPVDMFPRTPHVECCVLLCREFND